MSFPMWTQSLLPTLEAKEPEPGTAVEAHRAKRADPQSAPKQGPGRAPGRNRDRQGAGTVVVATRVGES